MPETLTRRALLGAAGGVTFLALAPARGGFAFATREPIPAGRFPLFTALPYLQPGPDGGPLHDDRESLVVAWQTDGRAAEFQVEVRGRGEFRPVRTERVIGDKEDAEKRYNYAAQIDGLALGTRYTYRVTMDGRTLLEGFFTTRKPRGRKTRFVAFGDNSFGDVSDRMIAHQAYRAAPDFVMNTGDNVYDDGTDDQYARHFFPVYNADQIGPRTGAPLLRSVPFYSVLGNHDVHGKDAKGHPVADFDKNPDSLAFFTNLHLPLNGRDPHPFVPTLQGAAKARSIFTTCAGDRFPTMGNYRFDYGDAHFLCLDSNLYVDPNDPALQAWIEADLNATDAAWKFVVFHHPSFHVGHEHFAEQHMRVLAPIFERCGVAVVLCGHEHTYQRTVPLRFAPTETKNASAVGTKARLVPGRFTLDRAYDGVRHTQPDGVIYVTTGAGGKHLYDPELNDNPALRLHPEDGNLNFLASFNSDRHSLTVVDMDAQSLSFRQVDQWGGTIDRFRITRRRP